MKNKIKDIKIFNLARSVLYRAEDEILDNNKIIEYLEKVPTGSNIIENKTFSKAIIYPSINYIQEDI